MVDIDCSMVVAKIFLPSSAGYLTLSVSSSLELSKLKSMVFQRVRKKYGIGNRKKSSFGSRGASVKGIRSPRWIQRLMKKEAKDYKLRWHLESDIRGLSAEQLSCVIANEKITVGTLTTVGSAEDASKVILLVTNEGEDACAGTSKRTSSDSESSEDKDVVSSTTWIRPIELELLEISKIAAGANDGKLFVNL